MAMRVGNFEVLVIAGSRVLEDVDIAGKAYVCSEPGLEYHVSVSVYRDPATGMFPAKFLRIGLYVDGIDVQYWKRLDLSTEEDLPQDIRTPVCAKFWGFKTSESELRSFVFASPAVDGSSKAKEDEAETAPLGTIRVDIFEALVTGGHYSNQQAAKDLPGQRHVAADAKFLKQASLITEGGAVIGQEKEKFTPLLRWTNLSRQPITSLLLLYHNRRVLNIMKQLTVSGSVGQKRSAVDRDDAPAAKFSRSNNNPQQIREHSEQDDEVQVVQKVIEAPMLDLSDDAIEPVWTTKAL